jgi:hypothetical protein
VSLVSTAPAIVVKGLVKRYGEMAALEGIDLSVPKGTVANAESAQAASFPRASSLAILAIAAPLAVWRYRRASGG